jgi:hypothetical protein
MRRSWNITLWVGFGIVLLGFASYIPLFALFPITRDVPWFNYLLLLAGAFFLAVGLKRAYGDTEHYRGKISGPILSVLSLLMIGVFLFGTLYASKLIPSSTGAPQVGQAAPPFVLASADGKQVSLADLLKGHRGAVLIFYRGYW